MAVGRRDGVVSGVLTLVRMRPDMARVARWAAHTGQRAFVVDPDYALHAIAKAALGELAPKPFALRRRNGITELIGYTGAAPEALERARSLDAHDPDAAAALRVEDLAVKAMPQDWRQGERLSFEVRVAPVVRSRSRVPGRYVEVDAAFRDCDAANVGDREALYHLWLQQQLARRGAAQLVAHDTVTFRLTRIARRTQTATAGDGNGPMRKASTGLLPDLTVRGELCIGDGPAFGELLARGLGRHRAFGFGCLLLAPPGAFFGRAG